MFTTVLVGPAGAAAKITPDKSYVLKSTAEAIHQLDPVTNIDTCNVNSMANIYDQLVRTTQSGQLAPGLAQSWKATNPTTFTMNLVPGVKFQDGTPFNSAAVAAAIKRDQTVPTSVLKTVTSTISSVSTPDATTVTLHLNAPVAGTMPSIFAGGAGEIPSPAAVTKAGATYGVTTAVGAGPYKVASFSANNSLSLVKFNGYWQKASQKFAGINFVDMADLTDSLHPAQVQQGTLDITAIKDSEVNLVVGKSGMKYMTSPSEQYAEIFFNFGVAPWNNPLVRKAAEYAVDRQALANALTSGTDKAAYQPLPYSDPGHLNSLDTLYPFNPIKAKQLLAQAGYPNGLKVTIGEIAFDYYERMAQAVQQMLNAAGFQVTLQPFAATAVLNILYVQKQFSAAITAFAPPSPGAYSVLSTSFASNGPYNISSTTTPGVDAALATAAASSNPKVQAKAYQAASKAIMDNALSVPLYFNDGVTVYGPHVQNVAVGQTSCLQANYGESPSIYASK